jgi:GNAT superfamily N-acetyltransferase
LIDLSRSPLVLIPTSLLEQGFSLRAEDARDEPFVIGLYRSTREAEMAMAGWDEEQKRQFIRHQFKAQQQHYRQAISGCSFDVIEREGVPVGRLYVEERVSQLHVVDITLSPSERGKGIGSVILRGLIAEAAAVGKGVGIFVERFNPVLSLYRRLGFVHLSDHGLYFEMESPAPEAVS